jgi:hypothetical protein
MSPAVPLIEQIHCVEREIALRERAYPRWVKNGRMSAIEADRELARMRAVLDTLLDLAR